MGQLDGKVALVTGGTRGIGRAIVERFAAEGAEVVTCGRSEAPAGFAHGNARIHYRTADVAKSADAAALIDVAVNTCGRLDILVNNAGIEIEKRLEDTSEADWERLVGSNLKGVFLCCKYAIPRMRDQGGGVIINMGSTSGHLSDANMPIYNMSKAGVHGLTRSIAIDHGPEGIRCNAICPGWIETDIMTQAFTQAADPVAARAAAVRRHPVRRFGTPDDIAAMALWLASDDSGFASGQLFTVDGGLTAGSPLNPGADDADC